MIKKLCVTGAILAAASGAALVATPAHADAYDNWSGVSGSWQSGNIFDDAAQSNVGSGRSVGVNNINGVTDVAYGNGLIVNYYFD